MKCEKCKCSVDSRPLMRVNPKGEKGIFWCHECVKQHEPELYNNEVQEMTDAEKDIIKMAYSAV